MLATSTTMHDILVTSLSWWCYLLSRKETTTMAMVTIPQCLSYYLMKLSQHFNSHNQFSSGMVMNYIQKNQKLFYFLFPSIFLSLLDINFIKYDKCYYLKCIERWQDENNRRIFDFSYIYYLTLNFFFFSFNRPYMKITFITQ